MKKLFILTMATVTFFVCANFIMAAQTTYRCDSMADAHLDQRDADLNFGANSSVKIVGDPLSAEVVRGIVRFNIPPFITADQIQSATIHLYGQRSDTLNVAFYAIEPGTVGETWFEKVVPEQADRTYEGVTWNELGGQIDSLEWTTPGGDYDSSVSDSGKIGSGWNAIGVKNLLTGNLDKVRKFGILVKLQNETEDIFNRFSSRESASNKPYLELVVNQELADGDFTCPATDDVFIDEEEPDINFNHKTRILISWDTEKGRARGLWKFDIPCNITPDIIASATLNFSGMVNYSGGIPGDVYCYALNDPFDEETASWNGLSGGNYDTSVSAAGSLPAGSDWELAIDATSLLAGNLDLARDNGIIMMFQEESGSDKFKTIAAKEQFNTEDFAAYLEITLSTADSDGDGVPDYKDNCPDVANDGQQDTYPAGGNGIGDACECEGNFDADQDVDGGDAAKFKSDFGRSGLSNPCPTCAR